MLALVQKIFRDQDPYSGDLYLFVNRRGDYVKILTWDRTGFVLFAKKLERGRFVRTIRSSPTFHFGRYSCWQKTLVSISRRHDARWTRSGQPG
ncbi:MAG: IS66 family insertion sequence hypothetical protein [Gammaproteobacteria bacterium]|nr:MAG: IS66 family insertion sequence hypothetical protein [Gammaproteobacteria bacterium]